MPAQQMDLSDQQRQAVRVLDCFLVLLVSGWLSGCLLDESRCTPADTTHSCCVKNHPMTPGACDGIEGTQGATFRLDASQKNPLSSVKPVLTAVATVALDDVDAFQATRAGIEQILEECARRAEEEINQGQLRERKPAKDDCDKEVGKQPNGRPITQAMRWGLEKHRVARECAQKRLNQLIPGNFSLEQRYRFDPVTGQKSLLNKEERDTLLRQGREKELEGTLEPDVVIHSGDPLHVWGIYDFKFPCPETNLPTWSRYHKGHPYQGRTQGEMYQRALGPSPSRVTPLDGVIPEPIW